MLGKLVSSCDEEITGQLDYYNHLNKLGRLELKAGDFQPPFRTVYLPAGNKDHY